MNTRYGKVTNWYNERGSVVKVMIAMVLAPFAFIGVILFLATLPLGMIIEKVYRELEGNPIID